jgi:hypothetical protein
MSNIPSFSDFSEESLLSIKIPLLDIIKVLEKEIVINFYTVSKSKTIGLELFFLNIDFENKKYIIRTSSKTLKDQIIKYEHKLPFKTKIIKYQRNYIFT